MDERPIGFTKKNLAEQIYQHFTAQDAKQLIDIINTCAAKLADGHLEKKQ